MMSMKLKETDNHTDLIDKVQALGLWKIYQKGPKFQEQFFENANQVTTKEKKELRRTLTKFILRTYLKDIKLTNKDLGNMSFVHFFQVLEREDKFEEAKGYLQHVEKMSDEVIMNLNISELSKKVFVICFLLEVKNQLELYFLNKEKYEEEISKRKKKKRQSVDMDFFEWLLN